MFDSLKFLMSAMVVLNKEPPKKHKFLILLRSCYSVMVDSIDANVDVFCETFVGFLKSVVLGHFTNYIQSYVNLNFKSRPKFNCRENKDRLF